ncbi:MAG TPA: ribosome small subunit-dependent GTPase A [Kofleriaceae bacterium]|nr:ribosome small subunit-dependent GTPase A [Kofleriaceae bacterium]
MSHHDSSVPHASDSLISLGYGPWFAAALSTLDRPDLVPARIVAVDRGRFHLAGARAPVAELTGRLRHELAPAEHPTVGDWVAIADDRERALVHAVLPRRTVMIRRAAGLAGEPQVVAANVDAFLIVTSANRDANPRRLERYLAIIRDSGAEPVVIVNKSDLGGDAEVVAELRAVAGGAPVLAVSAATGAGLDGVRALVGPGRTVGFVGSSGVGKSSLINRLLGRELQVTGAIDGEDRGRHTTTRRELIELPGGGVLVDTPGMRELGLIEDGGGLAASFADVTELAATCRFGDCRHDGEPGCAVAAAIDAGDLDEARLASWRKLEREVAHAERRRDPAAAARSKQRWKAINVAQRARAKVDPKQRC